MENTARKRRRGYVRRIAWCCALIGVAALAAGGYWYRRHKCYRHFAVHQEGVVYRSGWMSAGALKATIEDRRVRTVLNLCTRNEMTPQDWRDERRAVESSGARLIDLPMPLTTKLDDATTRRFVRLLGDPDNYPLLVHCQHGVTRTAKLLVIYDVAYRGLSAEESLRRMPLFGHHGHDVHVRAFARRFERRYRELYPKARPSRLAVLQDGPAPRE